MMISRLLLAGLVTALPAGSVRAQLFNGFGGPCTTMSSIGVPVPCTGLFDQILQYARQALQLEQESIAAVQEVTNTILLPVQTFENAAGQVKRVISLAQQADLLLGNTGRFIGNLNASSYPLPVNAMQQIVDHQNAIGNAVQQLGQVIGVINPQLASRAELLSVMQSQSFGAVGRMQALQVANQLAATTGQDMHSLVTLTSAMAQSQHAALLAEHDRRAMEDAKMNEFSTQYQSYVTTGWKGF